ncbi:hypothetical protein [Butyrivibrio sp. FCS014]|uniref:hypothetical protein n=1 Tax=Butyrivibrio sp. FCS014 TaxID=1408304 RepID=UPI000464E0E7|nr:hypothetical protein [Butyrivibrio sp. FCS014]
MDCESIKLDIRIYAGLILQQLKFHAFMKSCIKNKYYLKKAELKSHRKGGFMGFEHRENLDMDDLEKMLLDN